MKTTKIINHKTHIQANLLKCAYSALFLLLILNVKAQDKILLQNGSEILCIVSEVNENEVKYKAFENPQGPLYTIVKTSVFMISYENGLKTVIKTNTYSNAIPSDTDFVQGGEKKFGGPRLGFTYISPGTISEELNERGKNPFITQFGWQFETRLFSVPNGPSGLLEFVPLIGGMEQGLFLPSASMLIGLRGAGAESFEFAMGPNLSISGMGMVFAAGFNLRTANINFPVNIAYVPSVGRKTFSNGQFVQEETGHRISLLFGFNVRKR